MMKKAEYFEPATEDDINAGVVIHPGIKGQPFVKRYVEYDDRHCDKYGNAPKPEEKTNAQVHPTS